MCTEELVMDTALHNHQQGNSSLKAKKKKKTSKSPASNDPGYFNQRPKRSPVLTQIGPPAPYLSHGSTTQDPVTLVSFRPPSAPHHPPQPLFCRKESESGSK